ncbi:probable LRR receptor-like serine/threonine-protein kinase At4g31250 [Pistacia vera]|uniref:probable LRR receptor-like serine/threonine-protein kinase At4g31250 n=1 Tax=Pistacia vera TaxID=55513 RepID=UPI0012633868|nr:probable LRR receptor-like serine/threonine-protein kinase At4g31250 [Pistacia vera]
MARKLSNWVLSLMLTTFFVSSWGENAVILLNFKNSLSDNSALNDWNTSTTPCTGDTPNWTGLRCSDGNVFALILENMSLTGVIDIDTLAQLPLLRSLSFMYNNFDGPMPNVKKLTSLRALYLSYNKLSGEIPDDAFSEMNNLKKLHLARNQFMGKIPSSLVMKKPVGLSIEGNQFEGKIPNFPDTTQLTTLNMANNRLEGKIPASLSKFNSSSFTGNNGLCGKPLKACSSSKKKTILIIVVIVAVVVALAAIVGISYRRSKRSKTPNELKKNQETRALQKYGAYDMGQKEKEVPYSSDQLGGENGKLFFVRNDREKFELQDLLRASAQVLGSGSFGSSYKAVLLSGPAMVVKRFRQMSSVGKEDFHNHMRRLGSLSHPNLLALVAFYYRKEEKLLVSDFVSNGSLASHLHGKRSPGQPGLDWPTRLKIIKGVAKGLAYLYIEFPSVPLPHGHLKSSNVLLDHTFEPILTDYALVPVMNKEHAQLYMVAYKSPEFNQSDRITRKTDVWSLGILILELLTGKFPANYLKQGKGGNSDLATWVNSVVREEWTGEVFDKDMKGTRNGEGEMLKLLKIGMCCCEWNAERRWDFREAVEKIQELKERDSNTDIEDSSSYNSEDYGYSSRALTDDDFSFSVNG